MIAEKKKVYKIVAGFLLFFLILAGSLFFTSKLALADAEMEADMNSLAESQAAAAKEAAQAEAADTAVKICTNEAANACSDVAQQILGYWGCPQGILAMQTCTQMMEEENADLVDQTSWQQLTEQADKEAAKEKFKEILATSFRNSLKLFSRQIAHDTAVWVASGGKGQKPLFITEGWGNYLKNTADKALGDFIDNIGQSYGVDLCKPDLSIRLQIETGINWEKPRQVKCSFSQMMSNWQTAISNVDFKVEYTNAMRPGENDVSVFLDLQSKSFQKVAEAVDTAEKEAETNDLFTDVKDFAGDILTPGTVVADAFRNAVEPDTGEASFGMDTFTGTIADIMEEFLNTLVSELLKNLASGLFTNSSHSNSSNQPIKLPDLSALFKPNATPRTYEGAAGAESRFQSLIEAKTQIGGPYDILTKLMLCTDQNKNNLGPTDCVIDQVFFEAIRQKTQIKDLPQEILDRPFAPPINEVANPQVAFTDRNIKILRKYRIVPVGWEIAAEQIMNMGQGKTYTLGQAMSDPVLGKYFNPYWVLEAPELFCRQQGYGAHDSSAGSQGATISRDEYCADEQQCIQANDSGNCTAYGYCTEERSYWDLGSKTCEPRYNTCETFAGRDNLKDSWLVNTLDFRDCNESNYGCRWYSASYNTVDNIWEHLEPEQTMIKCDDPAGCHLAVPAPSPVVKQGHTMNDDQTVIMTQPCSADACSNANLINNGGFEDGLNGFTPNIPVAGSFDIVTSSNVQVSGGKLSFKLHNDCVLGVPGDNCDRGMYVSSANAIHLLQGKKYVVSVNVYLDIGAAYVDFGPYDASGNNETYQHNKWTKISYTTTTPSDEDVTPRVIISQGVTAYIDDFQVQEVDTNRCIYNEEARSCTFYQGDCTTTFNGVMCAVNNCQIGSNLLDNLNGSFENADGAAEFKAAQWDFTNSYYSLENRQYRDIKQGEGNHDLVMKSSGSTLPLSVKLKNIQLTPNKLYALKFKLKADYITQGGVNVSISEQDNQQIISGLSFQVLPAIWQDYYFQFTVPAAATSTYIEINTPAYSQLLAYADDFDIREVDQTCNANSIWLTRGTTTTTNKEIYFDAQASTCNGSAEGCSQFIRTKAGLGSNLLINGSFEDGLNYWSGGATSSAQFHSGSASLSATASYNNPDANQAIRLLAGNRYILSAWAYLPDNTGVAKIQLNTSDEVSADTAVTGTWQRIQVIYSPTADEDVSTVALTLGGGAYMDDVKLEEVYYNVDSASDYSDYNPLNRPANQLAYLKKAPDFFNCYRSNDAATLGQWADSSTLWGILAGQKPACKNYAPVCTKDEVGCELYTPVNGDPAVPGIVDTSDICPAECDGYAVYRQEQTSFVSPKYRQFIADSNLKTCSAAYAGCDEFTNLDKVGAGAEAREYYVNFRACQKPGGADEATYYTWEGSDINGYQLKIYRLKKSQKTIIDPASSGHAPCTYITYDAQGVASCSDDDSSGAIGNAGYCSRDEMFTNSDCREFYGATDGTVSYRLLSRTISISDDCHPYRRTQTQTNASEAQTDCNINQGYWNTVANACIYMAIPEQGLTCPSSVMGCREFTGNRANNVRDIINSDFGTDSVSTSSWQDENGGTTNIRISTESSFVGGYSISNNVGHYIRYPVNISKGRAYTLSFWAKADTSTGNFSFDLSHSIKFSSAPLESSSTFSLTSSTEGSLANSAPVVTTDWKKFDLGPVFVYWDPSADDEYLVFNIPSGNIVYLDNVILREVQEDIFAVDNSWYTPVSCDNKLGDDKGQKAIEANTCTPVVGSAEGTRCSPGEMVGCAAYKDRADNLNYFKSFAKLCRPEAAGCEALIDTYNYSPATGTVANAGDKAEITVKPDEMVYLVNDSKYACRDSEKGCTAYGLPTINQYNEVTGYNTVYLLNNPDIYNSIMCKFNEVWCDQYIGPTSIRYFKNPHGRVCQYEVKPGQLDGAWYVEGTDEPCASTMDQTLGRGYGKPLDKVQPVGVINNVTGDSATGYDGWVGTCPDSQSGCGEYVDPLPTIYTPLKIVSQKATIKTNTLYEVRGAAGDIVITADSSVDYRYGINPLSGVATATLAYPDNSNANTANKIKRFYVSCPPEKYADCKNNENISIKIEGTHPVLVRAGVYYVFGDGLDRSSCNGMVDFDTSCVLFNERSAMDFSSSTSWTDRVSKYLNYDAYATYVKNRNITYDLNTGAEIPGNIERTSPLSGQNDSNILIKVRPNRTCNTWLTCTTYEKKDANSANQFFGTEDKCLELGLCDSFNDQMVCNHFVSNTPSEIYDPLLDVNKTGYSYFGTGTNGYYSYELMQQLGESTNVVNGSFENAYGGKANASQKQVGEVTMPVTELTPIGWQPAFYTSATDPGYPIQKIFNVNGQEIILATGNNVAKEGANALMIRSGNAAISEYIDLDNNTDYYLSAWVKTKDLQGNNDPADPARAEIQMRFFDANGTIDTASPITAASYSLSHSPVDTNKIDGGWSFITDNPSPLHIPRGLDWQHVVLQFHTNSDTYRMQLALMNMNPSGGGYDNSTNFGGYTLWDDIQIKPLLKANDNQLVNRSCRVYPSQDAPSCKYIKGTNSYYGEYGYCLMDDPANPGQCLQWWPVDSIKGEVADDFSSYYQERAPLYYCIGKTTRSYNFLSSNILTTINTGKMPKEFSNVLKDQGDQMTFTPFSIPPTSRPVFRYPFIYKIPVTIMAVGAGLDKGIYGTVFWGDMYPKRFCPLSLGGFISNAILGGRELCFSQSKEKADPTETIGGEATSTPDCGGWLCQTVQDISGWFQNVEQNIANIFSAITNFIGKAIDKILKLFQILPEDEWGGFGIIPLAASGNGGGFAIPFPVPWHVAMQMKGGASGVLGAINQLFDAGIGGGVIGVRIITDADMSAVSGQGAQLGGAVVGDPVPSIPGDIIGYQSFVEAAGVFGAGSPVIIASDYNLEYCDRVVEVVNSSGQNKAWATRLTPASTYNSIDSDCVRDEVKAVGTGRGPDHCFYASNYCVMKDCVLNKDGICDFCQSFMGYLENNPVGPYKALKDLDKKDISDLVCADNGPGDNFSVVDSGYKTDKGKIYKLFKNDIECKDYFAFEYTNLLGLIQQISGTGIYVYKKIYSTNYFSYAGDYRPYGSLVTPNNGQYPTDWDSRPDVTGYQPLYYELPNTGISVPYQARMGQLHSVVGLKQLFGQTYGSWVFNVNSGHYMPTSSDSGLAWTLPDYCLNNSRPAFDITNPLGNFCRIRPAISNVNFVLLNDASSSPDTPLVVKASFNISVDADQVPIRLYSIDWGDGSHISYSGVSLLARPDPNSPFVLYHYYDRRKLQASDNVTTTIKVKDNWNAVNVVAFNFSINGLLSAIGPLNATDTCSCVDPANYCGDTFCNSLFGSNVAEPGQSDEPHEALADLSNISLKLDGGTYLSVNGNTTFSSGCGLFFAAKTIQESDITAEGFNASDPNNPTSVFLVHAACPFSGVDDGADCVTLDSISQSKSGFKNTRVTCYSDCSKNIDDTEPIGIGDKGDCKTFGFFNNDDSDTDLTFHFVKTGGSADPAIYYGDKVKIKMTINGADYYLRDDFKFDSSGANFQICGADGTCN